MTTLTDLQAELNRSSARSWEAFSSHRKHVMTQVTSILRRGPPSRLMVLGAGNCNDIDLHQLLERFSSIALVDLDEDSIAQGVARQRVSTDSRIELFGNTDLTGGLLARLDAIRQTQTASTDITETIARARDAYVTLPGGYDVVLSACLLSQLILTVTTIINDKHPQFLKLLLAVRDRHIRLLLELCRPGGQCVLITDFTSSDAAPALLHTENHQLPAVLARLLDEGNHFHGLHPGVLQRCFPRDSALAHSTTGASLSFPWRWKLGRRVYATVAIHAQRRPES